MAVNIALQALDLIFVSGFEFIFRGQPGRRPSWDQGLDCPF